MFRTNDGLTYWEFLTDDLILESEITENITKRPLRENRSIKLVKNIQKNPKKHHHRANRATDGGTYMKYCVCEFCGINGHLVPYCFDNAESSKYRFTDKAKQFLQLL